jgi:hypothetical protein
MKCKQQWLDAAEVFDTWRVVPRLIVFLYGAWMARVTDWIVTWYERLPAIERTVEVTAFATVVLPGIFGLAVWVYKIYSIGGRQWDGPVVSSSATMVSSTVTKAA